MKNKQLIQLIEIPQVEAGAYLTFAEERKHIPFLMKRYYFVHDMQIGELRGEHAHKKLKQVLFCVSGKIEITLDNGKKREAVILDKPNKGLFVGPATWREYKSLQKDSILFVIASENYSEWDYIRNYTEFVNYFNKGKYLQIFELGHKITKSLVSRLLSVVKRRILFKNI